MAKPSAQLIAQTNAQLLADPRFQAALAQYRSAVAAAPPKPTINDLRSNDSQDVAEGETRPEVLAAKQDFGRTVNAIVKEYHLPGQPQAWLMDPDRGQLVYEEDHSLRNIGIALGAIALAGGITAAVGSGAAAGSGAGATAVGTGTGTAAGVGTGTLAATTTVPTATGTIAGGTGLGAAGAGGAAGTGGAVTTAGIVGKLGGWGNLIGLGSQFAGQYLQNRANSQALDKQISASERAAELEAQSAREALDFTKSVYGREQEQLAPYVGAGGSAVTKLSQLMGLGTPPPYKPLPTQAPPPAAPGVMTNDPRLGPGASASTGAANAPQAVSSGSVPMVLVQAPTGEQQQIPQTELARAVALGARQVSGQQAPSTISGLRGLA